MTPDVNSSRPSAISGEADDLRADTGETLVLSPQSERFQRHYRTAQPRTAKEFRALVGVSEEAALTFRQRRGPSRSVDEVGGYVLPEELDSPDDHVRARATALASSALLEYLKSADPYMMPQVEAAIGRHLEIREVVLYLATLADIYVGDGATLVISDDTHLVEARNVVIKGSGKITCSGFTKFSVESIEGS